jgi:hypothetical protein
MPFVRRSIVILTVLLSCAGCGTTKYSDTQRTATEQLLISDAMDRAINQVDFRSLAGKTVFIDSEALTKMTDREYLVATLKQAMRAEGCIVQDEKDKADYVVEVRAGAVGTDRNDLLYGIPAVTVPQVPLVTSSVPSTIPEIPFVKKTQQRAVARIAISGYNRKTRAPIWQSGEKFAESDARHTWIFGAGPFERGSIYEGTNFAGDQLDIPLVNLMDKRGDEIDQVSVNDEAYFIEPREQVAMAEKKPEAGATVDDKKPADAATPAAAPAPATPAAEPAKPAAAEAKPTEAAPPAAAAAPLPPPPASLPAPPQAPLPDSQPWPAASPVMAPGVGMATPPLEPDVAMPPMIGPFGQPGTPEAPEEMLDAVLRVR